MAITIRSSFNIDAKPEDAWRSLIDIELSAPCFPGAELKEKQPDGSYKGAFSVKLGPLLLKFAGKFKITEQHDDTRTAVVTASGTDTKGRGGADAEIQVAVLDLDGKSKVDVVSNVNLSGTVAQYGRGAGMIEALSQQLLNQFAKNLTTLIETPFEGSDVEAPGVEAPAAEAPRVGASSADASGLGSPAADTVVAAAVVAAGTSGSGSAPGVEGELEPAHSTPEAQSQYASSTPNSPAAPPAMAAQATSPSQSALAAAPASRPAAASPSPPPRPRRPPQPVVPLDAGALMRKAMWQSIRNWFARLFGRRKP